MTTSPLSDNHTSATPSRVGWAALAVLSLTLAVILGIVTSGECYRGDCSVAYAGGPVGWVALSALLAQAAWAGLRAVRAPR